MFTLSLHSTVPPIPVTSVVVDLRNFTPHLLAAREDSEGVSGFCHFLNKFYALCLESCLVAVPPALRYQPPLYMSSTGDGVLIVFFDQLHYQQAFLAGLLMHILLRRSCEQYNRQVEDSSIPRTSFGIGMESGTASRLRAQSQNPTMHPIVDTYIGNCINVAARAEAVSKNLHRANTIIGPRLNELVSNHVSRQSYNALENESQDPALGEPERFRIYARMDELNRQLCVTYIHQHVLKGIDRPVPLFRVSDRSLAPENERFQALLKKLAGGSEAHYAEVIGFITGGPEVESKASGPAF